MRTSLFISGGAGFPSSSLVDASVAAVVSPPVDRRTMRVVWARLPVTRPYPRPVVVVVDATRVVARRVVVGIVVASQCGGPRTEGLSQYVFVYFEITSFCESSLYEIWQKIHGFGLDLDGLDG